MGRVDHAAEQAGLGYQVIAAAPQESYNGTGLSEFHAYALLAAGHVKEASAVAETRRRLCADMPGMVSAMAAAAVGMTALGAGDLATALRRLGGAAAGMGSYGEISGIFYRFKILHTEALARSGRLDAADAAWQAISSSRHPAYAYVESGYRLAGAWVSAAHGRVGEARRIAGSAAQFARDHGQWAREVVALQVAAQFGDTGVARRLDDLAALVEGPRAPTAARYAHALAAGDNAGLEVASQEFEDMGDRLAAADAAAQAATGYRRVGLRGSALSASARARQLAERCGGAISPALAGANMTLPLTGREREIAMLVAQGLSNRGIAEAMSLSVRTVEGHIYRATVKAGVASRDELSSMVKQFDQPSMPTG